MPYSITNIVGKIKLKKQPLELLCHLPGAKYYPHSRIKAVFLKLSHGSCCIFRTGTISLMGFKSIDRMRNAIDEIEFLLGDSFQPPDPTLTVANIVCAFKISHEVIDLASLWHFLSQKHPGGRVVYEPELNNTLVFNYGETSRILLHSTSSGIITGVKTEEEIVQMIDYLSVCICECKTLKQ